MYVRDRPIISNGFKILYIVRISQTLQCKDFKSVGNYWTIPNIITVKNDPPDLLKFLTKCLGKFQRKWPLKAFTHIASIFLSRMSLPIFGGQCPPQVSYPQHFCLFSICSAQQVEHGVFIHQAGVWENIFHH